MTDPGGRGARWGSVFCVALRAAERTERWSAMKSPVALLLTLGLGTILGFGVTVSLGVRDAVYNSASLTDPVYVAIKRNISTSYKELGNAWLPFDANAARDAYGEALQIDWFIRTSCPPDPESDANLAYSYSKLGEAALALDDYREAAD